MLVKRTTQKEIKEIVKSEMRRQLKSHIHIFSFRVRMNYLLKLYTAISEQYHIRIIIVCQQDIFLYFTVRHKENTNVSITLPFQRLIWSS